MGRLDAKHWTAIGAFLTALVAMLSGYDGWHDLTKMRVVLGIIGLAASHLVAIFTNAPENPNLGPYDNPNRRIDDPLPPSNDLGSVTDATRANLP